MRLASRDKSSPAVVGAGWSWVASLLFVFFVLDADGAVVRVRIVDASTGETTPAMVCITGSDGLVRLPPDGRVLEKPTAREEFFEGIRFDPDPNWIGPVRATSGVGSRSRQYGHGPSIPYWNEPVMYQVSGDFTIALPAGKWRIAVDRGMEVVPVFREVVIGNEASRTETIALERWVNLPELGWWSGDVHVHHPILEDAHREFLLEYARASDVHVVNVLEMGNTRETAFRQRGFGPEFRARSGDYHLVIGQEDPRSRFGHIIGLNLRSMVRDLDTYDYYDLTFEGIRNQPGGVVGFAHFAWRGMHLPRGFPWYVTTELLDFIELMQFNQTNEPDYYDYLNLGYRLAAAAGSDIPWGSTMGECRTYVYTGPELDVDSWFDGLRRGRTFVSNGPVLFFEVDGELPGEELKRAVGDWIKVTARVLGDPVVGLPLRLTIVGNEGVIKEVLNPESLSELAVTMDWRVGESQWLAAGAVSDNDGVAHTSPVYVVIDGRPTWSRTKGPALVARELAAIDAIAEELFVALDEREDEILERLERAREYYRALLEAMREAAN